MNFHAMGEERRGGEIRQGGRDSARGSGGEALRVEQRLKVGGVSQLFAGMLGAVELDDVHVLEVGEFAVNDAGVLTVFEEDRLTFSECHAGRVGQAAAVDQWREGGRETRG